MQCTRIYKEWTSHKNKEVKPIKLVQMNMVPKFYLKDVNWTKNGALRILATDVSTVSCKVRSHFCCLFMKELQISHDC